MSYKIFIGGWDNVGRGIIANILNNINYRVLNLDNIEKIVLTDLIEHYLETTDLYKPNASFSKRLYKIFEDYDVINYGHSSLILPTLKHIYPDMKFILCIFNPLQLNGDNYIFNELFTKSTHENTMVDYQRYHDNSYKYADSIVRLESLIFNPKSTILSIFDNIGVVCAYDQLYINKKFNDIYCKKISTYKTLINKIYIDTCHICQPNQIEKYMFYLNCLEKYSYVNNLNNKWIPVDYTNNLINFYEIEATRSLDDNDIDEDNIVSVINDIECQKWRSYTPKDTKPLKIAVCISGQARFVDGYHGVLTKHNLTDRYDCDFFCHYWWNDDDTKKYESSTWSGLGEVDIDKTAPDKIRQLYNPKVMKSDPILEDNIDHRKYPKTSSIRTPYNLTSMYTSIKRSYELMESYVEQTGVHYDYVVRYRYDGIIDFFPNLYLLPKNKIYYSNIIRDEMSIHNNCCIVPYKYSKQIFSIVNNLDYLYSRGVYFNDEQMCWGNLRLLNLTDKVVKLPKSVFHVDSYRPGKVDMNERRKVIIENTIRDYHRLTLYLQ